MAPMGAAPPRPARIRGKEKQAPYYFSVQKRKEHLHERFTTALKEALDGGKSLDEAAKEIPRKQAEKAVDAIVREEPTAHLGYEKGEQRSSAEAGDARNGSCKRKLLVTGVGPIWSNPSTART